MAGKFKIMGYDKGNDTYEQIEEARTKKEIERRKFYVVCSGNCVHERAYVKVRAHV